MGEIVKATKNGIKGLKIWFACLLAIILVVTSSAGSFLIISKVFEAKFNQMVNDQYKGETGERGPQGPMGVSILSIEKTGTNGNYDIYTISYSNGLTTTFQVKNGDDGDTPYIGENGHWWINGKDTGVLADLSLNMPFIGSNGHWWLGETDTGIKAQGQDGLTPHIGANGHWWIGEKDTGVEASGTGGSISTITPLDKSSQEYQNYITEHDLDADVTDVYKILYSNDSVSYFHVTNGRDGGNGGVNGTNGADANRWLSGASEPLETWGNPGDFYLCTSTNVVYQKQATATLNNQYNGKLVERTIDAETFANLQTNAANYGLSITATGITYADDITMTQITAMTTATGLEQSFYNYLWNYKLDGDNNAHLFGYYAAEGALEINGDTITKIHYAWQQITSLKGADGSNGSNGKSAYEVWRDFVDEDGTQPNKDKDENEFLNSLIIGSLEDFTILPSGFWGKKTDLSEEDLDDPEKVDPSEKYLYEIIDGVVYKNTMVTARGEQGATGQKGEQGAQGQQGYSAYELYTQTTTDNPVKSLDDWLASLVGAKGEQGEKGENGYTPEIGKNGNWWINGVDTHISATVRLPYIGENGNWFINGIDQNIKPTGERGNGIAKIEKTSSVDGVVDTYTITYTNPGLTPEDDGYLAPFTFTVTNGTNGKSAYEVWRDYTDEEGNQPNLHKSTAEFFQALMGADGNGVQSVELVSKGDSSNNYVDTYKITFTAQEPYFFTVRNGRDGLSAYQVWLQQHGYSIDDETHYDDFFASFAFDAINGLTILENGNWGIWAFEKYEDIPEDQKDNYVQGFDGAYYKDTEVQARGETGATGKSAYEIYCDTFRSDPRNEGQEPLNEYLWIQSLKGETGAAGKDAKLEISPDGYWIINDVKTNYKVTGEKGEQGDTPYIDEDGYWCVGDKNLGVLARGPKGDKGDTGATGVSITGVNKIGSDGVVDTYEITFSNGETSTFTVTNGKNGTNGTDGAGVSMDFGVPTATGKDGDIYINLNNGEMYRYTSGEGWGTVVGTMRGSQWFTGTKTLDELNKDSSGFNIDGFSVIKNDLYLNTETYDIYKYNGTQWEQLGNLNSKTDNLLSKKYISAIENSPYTKNGEKYGVQPGYFRLYNNPKKIVVIGNSITQHGYNEADNIAWTVPDMREMAASRPDSGWVTLIKKYINDDLGLTDCKIYKGNGSTWEVAANGSRSIDHILNQKTYEVLTTGTDLSTQGTFADVLTEDVDLILLQLSENMPAPTTDDAKKSTYRDWVNLYRSLNDLCPNAKIYQMTGFWPEINKMQVIMSVANNPVFNPLLIPGCMTNLNIELKAQPGDNIYDSEGEIISTVSQAVSGHPNDNGFLVMAEQFLDALFNDRSKYNQSDYRLTAAINTSANAEETTIFNPNFRPEIFHTRDTGTNITEVNFREKNSFLDYFMLQGRYTLTITYPGNEDRHGILVVEGPAAGASDGYNCVIQTILNANQGTYRSITRNVTLAAVGTVYQPWQFERQNTWITQRFDVSGLTISADTWTHLTGDLYKVPTQIKEAYYIVTVPSSGLDYRTVVSSPRILFTSNSTKISIAKPDAGEYTFPPNTYLEIVYK